MPKNTLFLEKAIKIAAALGDPPPTRCWTRKYGLRLRSRVYYSFFLLQLFIPRF